MARRIPLPEGLTARTHPEDGDALLVDLAELRRLEPDVTSAIAKALDHERHHRAQALELLESDEAYEDIAEAASMERMTAMMIHELEGISRRLADAGDTGEIEMHGPLQIRIFRNMERAACGAPPRKDRQPDRHARNISMDRTPAAADQRHEELGGDESVIPQGAYCYRFTGETKRTADGRPYPGTVPCPYWGANPEAGEQEYGYCAKLKLADWEGDEHGHIPLLWDMVKECGINDEEPCEQGTDNIPA